MIGPDLDILDSIETKGSFNYQWRNKYQRDEFKLKEKSKE